MEGSSVQNYKKTNPPTPTMGAGEGFLKQALDGLSPQLAQRAGRHSLAPTFFSVSIHSQHRTSLLPQTSVSPRCSYTSNALPSQYGGRGHTHRRDGGGGCSPHRNYKAKGLTSKNFGSWKLLPHLICLNSISQIQLATFYCQ